MPFPIDLPASLQQKARTLNIRSEDISEAFIRGGGAGGQKINKTNSCVLLRHAPTGTEVRCQAHREQSRNRMAAYKLLILKIEREVLGKTSDIEQKIFKLRKQKARRSRKAKEKMLEAKKRRGDIKENRKTVL